MGWMEILTLMAGPLHPGFVAKKELSKVPVLYGLTRALQSIYVDRAGSTAQTSIVLQQIEKR